MIKSGTRPALDLHKERKFHHRYGVVTMTATVPDFDLDAGLTMPDQNADERPYECVGYTTADIGTDITKATFCPDYSYAAARRVSGDGPEGAPGTSFHGGIQGAIFLGLLEAAAVPENLKTESEAQVSDYDIWVAYQRAARVYAQNGLLNVLGNSNPFDDIISAMTIGKIPVSVGSPWFPEFFDLKGGIVQKVPDTRNLNVGWHNYKAGKKVTIDSVPYIAMKSWQGPNVGDKGWIYFSREVTNATLSVFGSGAITIDPKAARWLSVLSILIQRNPTLIKYWPA